LSMPVPSIMVYAMKSSEAVPALNQLLHIVCRALPMYLADAKPWTRCGQQPLRMALDHLVADRQRYAQRLAESIVQLGGRPDPGRFPTEFTGKNDLALEYLLPEVCAAQKEDVARIEDCALQLTGAPWLHSLAEEIHGNAVGHLEVLQDALRAPP
jgi:bacterioferritin (cytochrome b1)